MGVIVTERRPKPTPPPRPTYKITTTDSVNSLTLTEDEAYQLYVRLTDIWTAKGIQ